MPSSTVPRRILFALDRLEPVARDHVLEIGCGNGMAAAQMQATKAFGFLLAIDRSATAVAAARLRNAAAIAQGRIDVRHYALAELPPAHRRFDLAFAINVNLFWRGATRDLIALRRQLASRGRLLLVWEPPAAGQASTIRKAATALLSDNGFVVEDIACDTVGRLPLLALDCRLPAR
jgi:protein-L-isoaspartate O-methyltransferase